MVNLFTVAIILVIAVRTYSFGRYNLQNNNKPAAVGSIIISIIALAFPLLVLFVRK